MTSSRDWNDIFLRYKVDDSTYCDNNVKIYRNVPKQCYESLDACVKYAMETGNHTAFVHFFMEKAKKQKEVFCHLFWQYLDEYEEVRKDRKLSKWSQFQILSSSYWRSLAFDYIEQNVNKYCYGTTILSKWKSMDGGIPDRDAIVQCCFYFGKNVEETNRLLIAGGQEQLYVLDIADAVAMHYLNKYCGNFEISAFEKLKEVKEKVNIALERCYKERKDIVIVRGFPSTELTGEEKLTKEEKEVLQVLQPKWERKKVAFDILNQNKDLKEEELKKLLQEKYGIEYYTTCAREIKGNEKRESYKNIKVYLLEKHKEFGNYLEWNSKTGTLYRFVKEPILKLGRTSAIGWDIGDEIEKYRNILQQEKENKKESGDTNYLTLLYTDKFLEEITDIDAFIESGTIGNSDEWVFAQKRYGYFLKTLQYIKEYEYYMKNLQYAICKVSSKGYAVTIDGLKKRGKFLDNTSAKFVKNIKENKAYEEEKLNRLLPQLLNKIWEISDAIDGKGYTGENVRVGDEKKVGRASNVEKRSGEFKIKHLIEGRDFSTRKDYEIESVVENKKDAKAFEQDLTGKMYVMKLALAAGRENEIGTYLQLAGYWDKDFTMIKDAEKKELLDRTDCLILYIVKYRDALLRKWAHLLEVDKLAYINEAKEEFPFIKLLMTINRDIQFVYEKIIETKTVLHEKELKRKKTEKKQLGDDLIYKNEWLQLEEEKE